ncbi:DnaJ sub C member 15 [Entomortierella chlamydospora]|uniref:Mitochondrial import inner membrane translocase subunit TIM14 n=1 Tax=Entomortierella chlamydospora TaxID=101097 RepID=A0A9P6T212_9FUNG|nr:DnaJ sub C member 15 [Entomortierella chlamydospora]KAG0019497.1 DnaJ sub C member 15 [Entomortierella chlamydospora]
MSTPLLIGVGIAGAAYGTKIALRTWELHGAKIMAAIPRPGTIGAGKYYKGGFETKMDKREAALILGLKESGLNSAKLKEAHRRIMLLNHPDRGGSPFLASKINEAKDLLDKK